MNRLFAVCFVGLFGAVGMGCSVSGVGDPCIPESEFDNKNFNQFDVNNLVIDVNSVQCETRVCLVHYFRGRVSCPFGNAAPNQGVTEGAKCLAVEGVRGLYTLDGSATGALCCPVLGDIDQKPTNFSVQAQCNDRQAKDAVYCSCRCDVPDDPEIDRSKVSLCECPDGYTCKRLCDQTTGNCGNPLIPKGKYGSYCVKNGPGTNFNPDQAEASCGAPRTP